MIGRARRGPRLRDQIAEKRGVVARMDGELRTLERELQAVRQRTLREAFPAARTHRRRDLTRERGLKREFDLGL